MTFRVDETNAGERLDVFLAGAAALSRSAAVSLIESGNATVNGVAVPKKYSVKAGDVIRLTPPLIKDAEAVAENIPLDVVYEDGDLLVINKPSGMVVHPAPGNESGTLVNALLHHCPDSLSGINGTARPGIVHRIDKDTSGLLVVAKNDAAHRALAAQLEGHHITREYHALVKGGFREPRGTVDRPIGRHPVDRKKMTVITDGTHTARPAVTHYEVVAQYGAISHLKLRLETGRTHQIRVHMAYIGHPLLGDPVYGGAPTPFEKRHAALLDGQMLHAARLSFTHPTTGEEVTFSSPLPENFQAMLRILEASH